MPFDIRDITDLAGCRAVVDVQLDVWGADSETVPASLLVASIKRGGILIGAWDAGELAAFVWSMPGVRDGAPTHWSHMLGVRTAARRHGLAALLKRAQRERALAQGIDLIEWTFDPLQAANAHFNINRLGCVSATYLPNLYGEMSGPLHRGTATDRLVAEWWIRRPHVERRLEARADGAVPLRAIDLRNVPDLIAVEAQGDWSAPKRITVSPEAPRLFIGVPPRFGEMQLSALEHARAWRTATRDAFTDCFTAGYRAVDFLIDRDRGGGRYLLAR